MKTETKAKPIRKSRLLKEIRLFTHNTQDSDIIDLMSSAQSQQVSMRFALKLREEWAYKLGDFDVLALHYDSSLEENRLCIKLPRFGMWCQEVTFGATKVSLADRHDYMVNLIAKACTLVALKHSSPLEPIEAVRAALLEDKEQATIYFKSRFGENKKYRWEPYLTVINQDDLNIQMYLKISDLQSGNVGNIFFLESNVLELYSLVDSLKIKNDVIVAKIAKSCTFANIYFARGFGIPQRKLSEIDFE